MLILLAKRESSTARPLIRLFEFYVPHVEPEYIFTDEGHDFEKLSTALDKARRSGVLMVDLRGFTEEDITGRFTSELKPPRLLILYGPSAHRLKGKVQRWVRGPVGGRVRSTVRLDLREILEHLLPDHSRGIDPDLIGPDSIME